MMKTLIRSFYSLTVNQTGSQKIIKSIMFCVSSANRNMFKASALFILILFIQASGFSADVLVETSTNDLNIEVNSSGEFTVKLSEPVPFPVSINFTYSGVDRGIAPLPDNLVIENGTIGNLKYTVFARKAGHTTVKVEVKPADVNASKDIKFETTDAFVRVAVFNDAPLNLFSTIVGWLYFICWSVSFYPQIINNYRRKSVVGLNFDFLALNLTGFIAYSLFNLGLRFSDEVQAEYHRLHPTGVIPVELNDVVFALHATFATLVTIGQCFIYERGDQLIAKTTVGILSLVWSTAGVFLLITSLGLNPYVPWLTFLLFFSYVKLMVTLTKYIPQVVYNYKRKSTTGWSIGTVLFDVVGGIFSIMQMFIIAYNYDDWNSIFGNFTKFGLGAASVLFDIIFMVQHYCLYRKPGKSNSMQSLLHEQSR